MSSIEIWLYHINDFLRDIWKIYNNKGNARPLKYKPYMTHSVVLVPWNTYTIKLDTIDGIHLTILMGDL